MKISSLKAALLCCLVLVGCSTGPQGRKQLVAPLPVSQAYSDADLRIKLATASSVASPCAGVECTRNQEFDAQVQSLGGRLAAAAFDNYPELIKRVSAFDFQVAEKAEPATTSNAAGKIVIYRGVQELGLDEAGVAFLLAREMGHVIGQHHDENSATRILLSVAAGVLFPALNLFNGSTAVAQQATQMTSATTLTTAAASTAASYVGSQAVLAGIKPDQLSEADLIALGLLEKEGWHLHDVVGVLSLADDINGSGAWVEDFRVSMARLQALDAEDQSTDLSQMPGAIALHVERECKAEPEASDAPLGDVPVMAREVAPEPVVVALAELPAAGDTHPESPAEAVPDEPVSEQVDEDIPLPPVRLQATPVLQRSGLSSAKSRLGKKMAKTADVKGVKKRRPGKPVVNAKHSAASKAAKPTKSGNGRKPSVKAKPARARRA